MDPRTWLVIATAAGFFITIGGLVAAWLGARREYHDATRRIDKMAELAAAEKAESDARHERYQASLPTDLEERIAYNATYSAEGDERNAYWTDEYAKWDLVRPSIRHSTSLAAYESKRLLGLVLNSTRRDFLIAAFGLLVSTGASVGSLYLTQ